ncbi:hypothetical protein [Mesotoga prima]|uniref:hypothetical protein n=1 Tax=Mesotoga prima TaxID=1184387 RepID=UPI002FD8C965
MRVPILDIFISDDNGEIKYSFFELSDNNRDIQLMVMSETDERSMGPESFLEAKLLYGRKDMTKTIFYTIIRPIEDAKISMEEDDSKAVQITEDIYDKYLHADNFVSLSPYGIGVQLECSNMMWLLEILSEEPAIQQFIKDLFEQKEISLEVPITY